MAADRAARKTAAVPVPVRRPVGGQKRAVSFDCFAIDGNCNKKSFNLFS